MKDDYHTGIRKLDDIKTFDEVVDDEESFVWGDFTKKDAEEALKDGKITVYSSYPIEQGVFVSTSKNQARDYAGGEGKQIYSKEVPLNDVAWINGDEGQYAEVENKNNLYYNSNKEEGAYENRKDKQQTTTKEQPQYKNITGRNGISTQTSIESPLGENVSAKEKAERIFKQFEQEANENALKTLNENQQKIKDEIKTKSGKDVVFFSGKQEYLGASSITDSNIVYVSAELTDTGKLFVSVHEIMESEIFHNQQ